MSKTFSLICEETRQRMWIGQGDESMTSFYSGDPKTMGDLKDFLNATCGKPLVFLCNDRNDWVYDYENFGDVSSSASQQPAPK